MKLIPLPAFADNYIWLLHDGQKALVVDPGDAKPVLDSLQREGVQLQTILVTHHHADHTGGVAELRDVTGATVFGPENEPMPEPLTRLAEGARISSLGLEFVVMEIPGHTLGHIAFYCAQVGDAPLVFCGDTLFNGGCGRLFEGTPAQMQTSLQRLASLPGHTQVCCTHEYTLSNLKFAREVEPDNTLLATYQAHCVTLREQGLPTLPTDITTQFQINPFLRTHLPTIAASVARFDAVQQAQDGTFAALRQWKNRY